MGRRGFTLIEVMMATVILAIVLMSTGRFSARFIHSLAMSQATTTAAEIATEQIEMISTDPSYTTLSARWAGTTNGFPGYPRMARQTVVQRITSTTPPRDYTVVTVVVTEPTMTTPVRLTTVVAQR
jgi:prepilin-type N-terminal cleavage/methylation domain-containing protein